MAQNAQRRCARGLWNMTALGSRLRRHRSPPNRDTDSLDRQHVSATPSSVEAA